MATFAFTLNTGEIKKAVDLDFNAFFALQELTSPNKKLKKAKRLFSREGGSTCPRLALAYYTNGVKFGFLDALKHNEKVISVCLLIDDYCLENKNDDNENDDNENNDNDNK